MSDREPKNWQRKLKEERHVHFVDIMDESRRAPPFDHFPITPSRRGGPIRRLLFKVIPCYSDREIKYLYEEKEAEPPIRKMIGEDQKKGMKKRKNEKENKNIKTKEDKIAKDKIESEKKVKDVTENEKKGTAQTRRTKTSSSLRPSSSAEGPQRKPKANKHRKRAQSASQRRSVLPLGKCRPLPPIPRKASKKQKTVLPEDSQRTSEKIEKQLAKSPQVSEVTSPRYPPTAARERRRNSTESIWRQMRYQQQKIGFILRDKAKARRLAELAKVRKNGTSKDGVVTKLVAQPMVHVAQQMAQVAQQMAQVESRMSCASAKMNQRDEILDHIELLERNACAQDDMLISINELLGLQCILSAEDFLLHKELLLLAADTDVISGRDGPSMSSTHEDKNSNTDELSDWEDLISISSESVSEQTTYSLGRKSTKKTYSRYAKAQKTTYKRKSYLVAQKSDSESSNSDDTCSSVQEQSEIELFPITKRSTSTGKKHKKRKSKKQNKLHVKLSEDMSRTPAKKVISDISDTDSNLSSDDTNRYQSVKNGNTDKRRSYTVEHKSDYSDSGKNYEESIMGQSETELVPVIKRSSTTKKDKKRKKRKSKQQITKLHEKSPEEDSQTQAKQVISDVSDTDNSLNNDDTYPAVNKGNTPGARNKRKTKGRQLMTIETLSSESESNLQTLTIDSNLNNDDTKGNASSPGDNKTKSHQRKRKPSRKMTVEISSSESESNLQTLNIDSNLNNDDTYPPTNNEYAPSPRNKKIKGRQLNGKPAKIMPVEISSSESTEFNLQTLNIDASPDDEAEQKTLQRKRTPKCSTRNLSEDDTPVHTVLRSPESAGSSSGRSKNRDHRRKRSSSQPERLEDVPERAQPSTSNVDEGCTSPVKHVSGRMRHAHKYTKSREPKCLALSDDEEKDQLAVNIAAAPAPESTTPSMKEETLICGKSTIKQKKQNKTKRSSEPKTTSLTSENFDNSENDFMSPNSVIVSTPTIEEAALTTMPMKTQNTHPRMTKQYKESEVAPPSNSEEPKCPTVPTAQTENTISNKPSRRPKRNANNRNRIKSALPTDDQDDHQTNEASLTTQQTHVDDKSTIPKKSDPKKLHWLDSDTGSDTDMSTKRQNIEKELKLKKSMSVNRERELSQKSEISSENPRVDDLSEKQTKLTTTQKTSSNSPGVKSRRNEREVSNQDVILSSTPDMVHGAAQRKEKRKTQKGETPVITVAPINNKELLTKSQGRLDCVALNHEIIKVQGPHSPPEEEESTSDEDCGFMTTAFPVKNTDTDPINDNPQTEQNVNEVSDVPNLTTERNELQGNEIASSSKDSEGESEKRDKKSKRSSSVWKKLQHNKIMFKKNKLSKHSTDLEKASAKSELKRASEMQMRDTVIDAEATREMCRDVERQGKEEEDTTSQPSDNSTTSKHKEHHKKIKTPKMLKKISKQQGLFKKKNKQKPANDVENPLLEGGNSQYVQDGSIEPETISDLCQGSGSEGSKKHHKKRKTPKALKKIAKHGLFKTKSQKAVEPSSGTEKSKQDDEPHSFDAGQSSQKANNNLCQATTSSQIGDGTENTGVEEDNYTQNDLETTDASEAIQRRKSMSKWKKFKHDQGLYKKQKNRNVKFSGEQQETLNHALGGVRDNNSVYKELMKRREEARKQKEKDKGLKKDLKKTKKQKHVLADDSARDQSTTSSSHGKKSKLANLLRGKKDHKIQTTQIVPQTSEMKENESPVGLASCRNGAPTAVNPDLELVGGETIREGNFMTANHTSHLVRPSKTSTAAADENQEAEVTDGWCDPTQNKLKLSNDVKEKKNDDQTGRISRRHCDTASGVRSFNPVEDNDVSGTGRDSNKIPTTQNGHTQGVLPARFDNSYKLPAKKSNSSQRDEDGAVSGQSQQRKQIMSQILQELDDTSSQSDREQEALIIDTPTQKVTEKKTSKSERSCTVDIINEITSPIPSRQVKLLPQAQVEESDDDVIPNLQRHQSKTEGSSPPVVEVRAAVEYNEEAGDNEKSESCDDMINHIIIKPQIDNSEHKPDYNSWDDESEEETTNQARQDNSPNVPRSPDIEFLDELLDELSPSSKKHGTTRQADSKSRQVARTDNPTKKTKGLNVIAADQKSDDVSLTQHAENAPEDQNCVNELDVIEQMLSTSAGKDDFDIFDIVDRMPKSKTKLVMLTTLLESSQEQTSEDDSSNSGQLSLNVVSANKHNDEPLHGENMIKQSQSNGNIKGTTSPKAESDVSYNSKQASFTSREEDSAMSLDDNVQGREVVKKESQKILDSVRSQEMVYSPGKKEEIDKQPIPREGRSPLVIVESKKPVDEKPIDTETHTAMSTQEKHIAGGKIIVNPAWGISSLDDFNPSSTRRQDVTVGSDISGEVEKQSPTSNLNRTDDVTRDVPRSPSSESEIYSDGDSSVSLDMTQQPVTPEDKDENTSKPNFLDYLTQLKLEESLKKAGKPVTVSPFENSDVPSYLRTDFNPSPEQKPFKRWDPAAAQKTMEKICRSKNKSKETSAEPRWLKEDFHPAPEQKPFKKWNPVVAQKTMQKISGIKTTTEKPEPRWLKNDFNPAPEQKPFKRWDPSVAQNKMEKIGLSKKKFPEPTEVPRWLQKDFNPVENGRKADDWKVPGAKSDVLSSTPDESKDSAEYCWDTDSSMSLEDKVQGREAIRKESQKIIDSMRSQEMFHSSGKESSTKLSTSSTSTAVDKDIPRFLRADFNPAPEQKPFKRWNSAEAKKKLDKIGDPNKKFPENTKDEKPMWLKNDFNPTRKETKPGAATNETAKDASTPRWLQPNFDPAAEATSVSEPSKRTTHNMPPTAQFQHPALGQPTYQPDTDMFDIHSEALLDETRHQPRFIRDIHGQPADPARRERSLIDNPPQRMQSGFHSVPGHAPAYRQGELQSQVQALGKSSNVPAWLQSKPQPLPETTRNMPQLPGVSPISTHNTHHGMDNCKTDVRPGRTTFRQFAPPPRQTDGLDVISSDMEYEETYPSGLGNSDLPRPSWMKPGLAPAGNAWQNSANERRILFNSISKTQARFTNRIM
ncbi:microtubule-associated protein futsch-like [Asterias rubens]|uniref:microtubule-associated protein futsch-like n=1 Tax=Asterias rubens TaxID=7604 RepID=UPI001454ECAE|nr:microtubule-associated protein futsch-like [Asterias rubens]